MITKRIAGRKDGGTSAKAALRYGEGLKRDRKNGNLLSKSLRTRIANFSIVDDGIFVGKSPSEMEEILGLAAAEMRATCDRNTRVKATNKIGHFLFSFDQYQPTEAVLRDTEDSMLSALGLSDHHWASFLHSDNGHWHLHLFASRISKITHRGNDLSMDQTIRDRVAREIELRHVGLPRDNGLHEIDENGRIVQVPKQERMKRKGLKSIKTDKAQTVEIHAGEKTFQSWAEEIRIGDRLKHAKSWQDIHSAAAAYGCEIRQKGAGFIICPRGETGGIQLSRIGLKNLPAKFGAYQPPTQDSQHVNPVAAYKRSPRIEQGATLYSKWRDSKKAFQTVKTDQLNELRERHSAHRNQLKAAHRTELAAIRGRTSGDERFAATSVAKMQQAIQLSSLADRCRQERKELYQELAAQGPGNTYREYLVREAQKGDNAALQLARKYGMDEETKVSREREEGLLKVIAVIAGNEYVPAPRLQFTHHVESSGSVVYQLGRDRLIIDSAVARRIQLNDAATHDPEAISTALRFATLKFGSTLNLTGPAEFQRQAVEIAVRERLGIRFTDLALDAYRLKLIEQQKLIAYPSYPRNKESHNASHHRSQHLKQTPPAHIRNRLHDMSLGDMVLDTSRDVMPLRQNVPHRVEQQEEGHDRTLQRAAGRSQRAGDAGRKRGFAERADGASQGAGNNREEIPLTQSQAQAEAHVSVRVWAEEWAKTNGKPVVEPRAGIGKVQFKVIHVEAGNAVLDLGRMIAIYPKPTDQSLKVGDKVTVGKQLQILLQQKSIGPTFER